MLFDHVQFVFVTAVPEKNLMFIAHKKYYNFAVVLCFVVINTVVIYFFNVLGTVTKVKLLKNFNLT